MATNGPNGDCNPHGNESGIRKIAVIGATGMLGIPVVAALLEAGYEVTALVRNPEKARKVLPAATSIVEADLRDASSLVQGLAGQDAVYLSLAIDMGAKQDDFHAEDQGLSNILLAARLAGIKRIGYLSALIQDTATTQWWVLDVWKKAIEAIKSSGIPYTIFYPTNFMETLPQRHRLGCVLALIGSASNANYWIAARDYGTQVARAFGIAAAANRDYVVQGPEPMTYSEAGRRFAGSFGTKLQVITIPLMLISWLGVFSRHLRYNSNVMQAVLGYPERFAAAETWRDLGRPETTIDEFARNLPAPIPSGWCLCR